ncbi:hypothetical protein [Pseudonocardia nigra]|uniref:hypothetical protein n=1 Tax=Pseudonocardia nigra TaxID=1921578 RepID=UPI001C5D33A9|nr:hypothetical protein [Pseudonocardia nigra]
MGKPDQPRDKSGRWIPRSGGAFAAVVAVSVALAAGPGVIGSSGAGSSAGSTVRAQGAPKGHAKARDRSSARTVLRLEQRGLRVERRVTSDAADCAAHSYGLVREFFQEQPCSALYRPLFEVHDTRRDVVLVAVAWVDMPDVDQARAFKRLVDRHGTGNVTELSRETRRYRNVRFSGEYYASVRNDSTVINVQAQPVSRAGAGLDLAEQVVEAVISG